MPTTCPACGEQMIQGVCKNPDCESNQAPTGGGWQATDPNENLTKTYAEWCEEYEVHPTEVPDAFLEADGMYDASSRYTRDDFLRRMS